MSIDTVKKALVVGVPVFFLVALNFTSCGKDDDDDDAAVVAPKSWVQIERLGRPAINEGLILSNDYLNAFNSIPPTHDLGTEGDDATKALVGKVLEEAATVLGLADKYGETAASVAADKISTTAVVNGFLPDVMRIDTEATVAVGTPAYNAATCSLTIGTDTGVALCGGRKIEDDVMDITLSYLIAGDPTGGAVKDNVAYAGTITGGTATPDCSTPGEAAGIPGHQCLYGQTTRGGSAKFPYLAKPN